MNWKELLIFSVYQWWWNYWWEWKRMGPIQTSNDGPRASGIRSVRRDYRHRRSRESWKTGSTITKILSIKKVLKKLFFVILHRSLKRTSRQFDCYCIENQNNKKFVAVLVFGTFASCKFQQCKLFFPIILFQVTIINSIICLLVYLYRKRRRNCNT